MSSRRLTLFTSSRSRLGWPEPLPVTTRSESSVKGDTLIGVLTVTLTLVGWSVTPLFIKFFTEHIDAWTSNRWRYAFVRVDTMIT